MKRWLMPLLAGPPLALAAVTYPSGVSAATRTTPPAAAAARTPVSCAVHALPMPAGHRQGQVFAADSTGRYVLGRRYDDDRFLLWHDGKLGPLLPASFWLGDVNRDGTVVGRDDRKRAVVVHRGRVTVLPGGGDSSADAINDAGVVVGTRLAGRHETVMRWMSPSRSPQVQPAVPGYPALQQVGGIAADGSVLSILSPNEGYPPSSAVVYVWPVHGAGYRLPRLPVAGRVSDVSVVGVRGMVVGIRVRVGPHATPVTFDYDLRTRTFSRLRTADGLTTDGVDAQGWVTGGVGAGPVREYLVTARQRIALTPLPGPAHRHDEAQPAGISDDGRIIAGTSVGPDRDKGDRPGTPVVWACH